MGDIITIRANGNANPGVSSLQPKPFDRHRT
jgi:hypothetical protein